MMVMTCFLLSIREKLEELKITHVNVISWEFIENA